MVIKEHDLTPEFNRVSIWEEALRNSYHYLLSIKDFDKVEIDKEAYINYEFNGGVVNFHKELTTNHGLREAAIINFMSIFSSGKEGNMIAGQRNEKIKELREKLIENSIQDLGWSINAFDNFLEVIKTQRDKFLAHYDGDAGDFKEEIKGISSRKMVGAQLSAEEQVSFKDVVKAFLENANKLAYGK